MVVMTSDSDTGGDGSERLPSLDDADEFTTLPAEGDASDLPNDAASGTDAETSRGPQHRLRFVLGAVLVGAVVAGGVLFATDAFAEGGGVGSTEIGESSTIDDDLSRSEPGDCLQWTVNPPSQASIVDCADPHRFEVAGTLDTSAFPSSEFAADAPWPGEERFASIRDENCPAVVDRYLGGGLDPAGRFSVGLMRPGRAQWERGARVLRCGIEQAGAKGVQEEFTGRVADVDQSFAWPVGTCIGINKETREPTGKVVNCAEPHAFQTTGVIDLSQRFGGRNSGKPWPNTETQNDYLKRICPSQTNKFFGGADKFADTTLNVQWSVAAEVGWLTGSRRVACYVALPDRGGFATLVGDARQGELLINGRVPVPPKKGPPGRSLGTPVPLPPGYNVDDREIPAPGG